MSYRGQALLQPEDPAGQAVPYDGLGVLPIHSGVPSVMPASLTEICHDIDIWHFEYLNHSTYNLYNELWLLHGPVFGTTVNFTMWQRKDVDWVEQEGYWSTQRNPEPQSESGPNGHWFMVSRTGVPEAGFNMKFDHRGSFAAPLHLQKYTECERGLCCAPHRLWNYHYGGTDYLNRVVWLRLLHRFRLDNTYLRNIPRPRGRLCQVESPFPPPGRLDFDRLEAEDDLEPGLPSKAPRID